MKQIIKEEILELSDTEYKAEFWYSLDGKNVIKKCKENSMNKNIDDEWMYLIEFLAHKRAGDF